MRYDKARKREEKQSQALSKASANLLAEKLENDRLRSIIDGLLHETKRINSEISSFCEELGKVASDGDASRVSELAESVNYASGLISSRLVFTDFELNPQSLGRQPAIRMGVYKKFDKARRLLYKSARSKQINIQFSGNSFTEIEAIPALELVPFVILDNAIKYSPRSQSIDVEFEERPSINCRARVTVSSIGPHVSPEEIPYILERGKRGANAERVRVAGDGLGLFLADTLSKTANAKLSVTSSTSILYSFDGVPYSNFKAILDFYKTSRWS